MKHMNHLKSLLCLAAAVAMVGCSATRYSRSTGQYIDDNATTARVNSALGSDSILEASGINVATFRGNVHLTGFVDHPIQKERASQIARNVQGVQWFKNDIIVKEQLPAPQQVSQSQRIDEPSGAARSEGRQSFSGSGQASRSGQGGGWEKGSLHAYDPAAQISSRNGATIKGSAGGASASASAEVANEPAGADAGNGLTQRINSQLRSDGSGAAQNVNVQADENGKVTLRGMVSSEQEKRSIENRVKAIQGVSSVDNELEVQE